MGRWAKDGDRPFCPRHPKHLGLVSSSPTPGPTRATRHVSSQGTGTLPVLRRPREQRLAGLVPVPGCPCLAQVVGPPPSRRPDIVEGLSSPPGTISDPECPTATIRSQTVIRRAVCIRTCTYGSVGAVGEQSPMATRPGSVPACRDATLGNGLNESTVP